MPRTKRFGLAAAAVAFLGISSPTPAGADPPGQVVVGQDSAAVDVAAVQAAVGAGGRVVLVGTFDFGPTGRVIIGRDVHISGRDGATIKRGSPPFLSSLPAPVGSPPAQPGPAVAIENLTFDGATSAPIRIAYARSVEIERNVIRNVVPLFNPAIGYPVQSGIMVSTQFQYAAAVVPGAITGRVRIRHNHLDMTSATPATTVCSAIEVARGWGADVEISHNAVSSCARNGVVAIDNVRDDAGAGRIRVSHNRLRSDSTGAPWPVPFRPGGIVAGSFFFPAGAIDPVRNPAYEVSENEIDMSGPAGAFGIFASSNGVVLEENRVAVSGPGARGIVLASANCLVKENRVAGDGQLGIQVAPFFPLVPAVVADHNTLLCNDLAGFRAAVADLGLAGSHNTVVGTWKSVVDTGVGNQLVPSGECEDGER